MTDRLPPIHTRKASRDTAEWCFERAAADRAAAMTSSNENIRQRFERSAESWGARAEILARVEDGMGSRIAVADA